MAGPIIVPQATDIERVAQGTNHETCLGPQDVDDGAAKEADESKEAVEDGIGLVGDVGRGRMSAAGSESGEGRVDSRETE